MQYIAWFLAFTLCVSATAQVPGSPDPPFPICQKKSGMRLVGGGMGLHFAIPKKGYKFRRGKWDTDYVVHIVTPEKGSAVLQLWFGVGPLNLAPRLELLGGSTNVETRRFSAGRKAVQDSRGHSEQGYWRQVALGWGIAGRESGEGAIYEGASIEDAAKLDVILDSACYMQSPSKIDR